MQHNNQSTMDWLHKMSPLLQAEDMQAEIPKLQLRVWAIGLAGMLALSAIM